MRTYIAIAGLEQVGKQAQGIPLLRDGHTGLRKKSNHLVVAAEYGARLAAEWFHALHLLRSIADVPDFGTRRLGTGGHYKGARVGALP